ncbi:MAG: hypothetical protein JSS95_11125 [Acidobacteria bacterium]|nr:hypothetical protein [Acidobacteriota bacterium]
MAGVAGCILPILPGIPLVLAGLLILAQDYLWAKSALHKTKRWAVHVRRKARAKRAASKATATGDTAKKSVERV